MDSASITTLEQRIIEQVQKRLNEIKTATERERLIDSYSKSNQLTLLNYAENSGMSAQAEKKLEAIGDEVTRAFLEAMDRIDRTNIQRSNKIAVLLTTGVVLGIACLLFT